MPGPTLLTLRRLTYLRLGENSALRSIDESDTNFSENPNYPLAMVDAAINAALDEIALRTDHDGFKESDTANIVNGEVAVPATFGNRLALSVRFSTGQSWTPLPEYREDAMDIRRPDWRTTTVPHPDGYYVKAKANGTIVYSLVPQISATITGALLRRWTVSLGTLAVKTDTADVLQLFKGQQFTFVPNMAAHFLVMNDSEDERGIERAGEFLQVAERDIGLMRMKLKSLTAANFATTRQR